jgi:hypothetical protein
MAGAKQRNPGARRTGRDDAGTLLVRAGAERENDRDNRVGAGSTLTSAFPRSNYSSSVNPTRKVT